jgi:hypothetical protein
MGRKKRKKGRRGHFCKGCYTYLPNEKFNGKGHRQHLCKKCIKKRSHVKLEDTEKTYLLIEGDTDYAVPFGFTQEDWENLDSAILQYANRTKGNQGRFSWFFFVLPL